VRCQENDVSEQGKDLSRRGVHGGDDNTICHKRLQGQHDKFSRHRVKACGEFRCMYDVDR